MAAFSQLLPPLNVFVLACTYKHAFTVYDHRCPRKVFPCIQVRPIRPRYDVGCVHVLVYLHITVVHTSGSLYRPTILSQSLGAVTADDTRWLRLAVDSNTALQSLVCTSDVRPLQSYVGHTDASNQSVQRLHVLHNTADHSY